MARITVNGEDRQVAPGRTVSEFLGDLEIDPRTVAIELSGRVLPRGEFPDTEIRDGDRLEIVRFVQGG